MIENSFIYALKQAKVMLRTFWFLQALQKGRWTFQSTAEIFHQQYFRFQKCLVKFPSIAALICATHSGIFIGRPLRADAANSDSIFSMLKFPFFSITSSISFGHGQYIGMLKESTSSSAIIPWKKGKKKKSWIVWLCNLNNN